MITVRYRLNNEEKVYEIEENKTKVFQEFLLHVQAIHNLQGYIFAQYPNGEKITNVLQELRRVIEPGEIVEISNDFRESTASGGFVTSSRAVGTRGIVSVGTGYASKGSYDKEARVFQGGTGLGADAKGAWGNGSDAYAGGASYNFEGKESHEPMTVKGGSAAGGQFRLVE